MGYCMDFVHSIVLTEYLRLENRYKDYLSASGWIDVKMKILLDISEIVNLYGGRSNGPYGAKAGGWVIPHLWRTNCPISECHISLPLLSKGHRWCI